MRVRALSHDKVEKGKIYKALGPDKDNAYAVLNEDGYLVGLTEGNYELLTFTPGSADYFIRIKNEQHFEYVASLLDKLGYHWPLGCRKYVNEYAIALGSNMMIGVWQDSNCGYSPNNHPIEITTDDLLWYEAEPTLEEVLTDFLVGCWTGAYPGSMGENFKEALDEAGYRIVRK